MSRSQRNERERRSVNDRNTVKTARASAQEPQSLIQQIEEVEKEVPERAKQAVFNTTIYNVTQGNEGGGSGWGFTGMNGIQYGWPDGYGYLPPDWINYFEQMGAGQGLSLPYPDFINGLRDYIYIDGVGYVDPNWEGWRDNPYFVEEEVPEEEPSSGAGLVPGGSSQVLAGLPYVIPVTPTWVGPSFIVNSAARRVIDWFGATDFTVATAASGTMVGVNGTAAGPWIFYQSSTVASNALHIIYNGVGTTHNYGNLIFGGLWSGGLYIYAGAKNGATTDHYILRIGTDGTITEIPVLSANKLSFGASPAPWGAGGPWGIIFIEGGSTGYKILTYDGSFQTLRTGGFGVTRPTGGSVDNQYLSWRTGNRSFAQYDLTMGITYQINNVLPADAETDTLIAVGNGVVVFGGRNTTIDIQALYTADQVSSEETILSGTDSGVRANVYSNGYTFLYVYRISGTSYIDSL